MADIADIYTAAADRYEKMTYNRVGRSGLKFPAVSLGLWHNFGSKDNYDNMKAMCRTAFDNGITQFDVANNYGPVYGSAEKGLGRILKDDFMPYRDELVIATKAGYDMWDGPYGDGGSRKYLMASLDQSLKRLGLDYVDVFYHHRPDPETPLEETMGALSDAVRQGKALYVAISNYQAPEAEKAIAMLRANGTPCLLHQPRYNMLERWVEDGLLELLDREGVGCICFSPLAQGALTDKYLSGVPEGSRASREGNTIGGRYLSEESLVKIRELNQIAASRGQTLAQMALAWVLRRNEVTSVLIGASSTAQLEDNVAALDHLAFEPDELEKIESVLNR